MTHSSATIFYDKWLACICYSGMASILDSLSQVSFKSDINTKLLFNSVKETVYNNNETMANQEKEICHSGQGLLQIGFYLEILGSSYSEFHNTLAAPILCYVEKLVTSFKS